MRKRKEYIDEIVNKGGDKLFATIRAEMKFGSGTEYMVKEKEISIFREEENWKMPWSDVIQENKNAFFKLFLNQVGPVSYGEEEKDDNRSEPDYRPLLLSFLVHEKEFVRKWRNRAKQNKPVK